MNGSFTLIWLYFLFPQYSNKDCTEGYSSYHINIWGLREPAKNKAQNKSLTDQQITNLLHHLKTCHGVSWEEVNSGHLPVETPLSRNVDSQLINFAPYVFVCQLESMCYQFYCNLFHSIRCQGRRFGSISHQMQMRTGISGVT